MNPPGLQEQLNHTPHLDGFIIFHGTKLFIGAGEEKNIANGGRCTGLCPMRRMSDLDAFSGPKKLLKKSFKSDWELDLPHANPSCPGTKTEVPSSSSQLLALL